MSKHIGCISDQMTHCYRCNLTTGIDSPQFETHCQSSNIFLCVPMLKELTSFDASQKSITVNGTNAQVIQYLERYPKHAYL